jgi:hypothetical protein
MLSKNIIYFGRQTTMCCDGKCDKAWGANCRPRIFFTKEGIPLSKPDYREGGMDNFDNNAYIPDQMLGEAPEDPGTYEGGEGKPGMVEVNADPELMNKWCARECERNIMEDQELHNFSTFVFNMPEIQAKVTSKLGWEKELFPIVYEALRNKE